MVLLFKINTHTYKYTLEFKLALPELVHLSLQNVKFTVLDSYQKCIRIEIWLLKIPGNKQYNGTVDSIIEAISLSSFLSFSPDFTTKTTNEMDQIYWKMLQTNRTIHISDQWSWRRYHESFPFFHHSLTHSCNVSVVFFLC